MTCRLFAAGALLTGMAGGAYAQAGSPAGPADEVNVFIGTTNGGNVYPGATLPFGMVAFSPEETGLPGIACRSRRPAAMNGGPMACAVSR